VCKCYLIKITVINFVSDRLLEIKFPMFSIKTSAVAFSAWKLFFKR
jgi:hypothetical protein